MCGARGFVLGIGDGNGDEFVRGGEMSERRYGQWAGNPKGVTEDKECCIEEVWPSGRIGGFVPYQCSRKRGYGPEKLYCKQHAKQRNSP